MACWRGALRPGRVGLLVIAAIAVSVPGVAFADDTNVGRAADGVYPVESTDITMVEEDVTIDITPWGPGDWPIGSEVTCVFTFLNQASEPRKVLMAFPAEALPPGDSPTDNLKVQEFEAFVGGRPVPVALEPASDLQPSGAPTLYASWYTFHVPFAAGQEVTVVNTYEIRHTYNSVAEAYIHYVLQTGRFWRGPIGKATVTVNLGTVGPQAVDNLYPADWRFSPDARSLAWQGEDFEPARDLLVRYNFREWGDWGSDYSERAAERKAELMGLVDRAAELGPALLQTYYAQAAADGDTVKAILVRSLLPPGAIPEQPPVVTSLDVVGPGTPGWPPETAPILKVGYADPDADIVSFRVKVTHEEEGRQIVDLDLDEGDRWVYEASSAGILEFSLGNEPDYRIEVTLEDAAGHVATRESAYHSGGEAGGGGPGDGTTGPPGGSSAAPPGGSPTAGAGSRRVAWTLVVALGVLAAVGVLVVPRLRSGRR